MNTPFIIDATLREGAQAPGVRFSVDATVEIAKALIRLGVDMIECGHPFASAAERARTRAVTSIQARPPVLGHARCRTEDIDAVAESQAEYVGLFIGINEVSRKTRLSGIDVACTLSMIRQSIAHARQAGLKIRFSVEDASRTDDALLERAYKTALDCGAERLCFTDTVGILEPPQTRSKLEAIRGYIGGAPLEVHLHDDRGLAVANALEAFDCQVQWFSTSINGLGERCGILDTATFSANLAHRGVPLRLALGGLRGLSELVASHSRAHPDARRPIVGLNAFRHTAKLHQAAAAIDPAAYEWIAAELFGAEVSPSNALLPESVHQLVNKPRTIGSSELPFHRDGPGQRFVMLDDRFVPDARQYCIVREIPALEDYGPGHVDIHRHNTDSLFLFLGSRDRLQGLSVEVQLAGTIMTIDSPAAVFIPAGVYHTYRVISGAGLFINHVGTGSYTASLLAGSVHGQHQG